MAESDRHPIFDIGGIPTRKEVEFALQQAMQHGSVTLVGVTGVELDEKEKQPEWPDTARRVNGDPDREEIPLIPADLGRELYEALKGWTAADLRAAKRTWDALARYECEVGDG